MPTNFLSEWSNFTRGTEAPEQYYLWSGISALSSIMGRRVWLPYGRFTFYPNIYTVLLGPAGNGKTTAMAIAKNLIRELGIPFSAECQTKESLVKEWIQYERTFEVNGKKLIYTPISIFVTELSHFLGPNSAHMIDFLTTTFDQDVYDAKTKNKGNDLIMGPAITMLACTTPEWVTTYLKSDIISGGFSRRALFINEFEGKYRISFPETSPEQKTAALAFTAYARGLQDVAGGFVWDQAAKSFFTHWYENYVLPTDPTIRSYHRTKHTMVMKVAMLIALAESHDLVMRKHHLEITLELFTGMELNLLKVFQGMGRNELNTVGTRILDIIRANNGSISEKELLRVTSRDASTQEQFSVIGHLEKTDQIVRLEEKAGNLKRIIIALPEVAAARLRGASSAPQSAPPSVDLFQDTSA